MNQIGARDDQAGFTLVELLVALALTAAIANFIVGGFQLVRRAAAITYDRESAEEVDAAATQLRGLLARTTPVTTIDDADSIARLVFEGRTDAITFVALSEATAFQGGLMRVRLSCRAAGGSIGNRKDGSRGSGPRDPVADDAPGPRGAGWTHTIRQFIRHQRRPNRSRGLANRRRAFCQFKVSVVAGLDLTES